MKIIQSRSPRTGRKRLFTILGLAAAAVLITFGTVLQLHLSNSQIPLSPEKTAHPVPAVSSVKKKKTVSKVPRASSAQQAPFCTPAVKQTLPNGRMVYLTFDDGPSSLTAPLLDMLDRYGVKATFFVVGAYDKNETVDLKEIARRGHTIGVHSYSHDYRKIYASPEAFFRDFDRMHTLIQQATGVDAKILRFPGGSVNGYNKKTRAAILKGLQRRGYVYYDWNVSAEDAVRRPASQNLVQNVLRGVHQHRVSVVLMHNTAAKEATLRAMPQILKSLKSEGYAFGKLDPSVSSGPFAF